MNFKYNFKKNSKILFIDEASGNLHFGVFINRYSLDNPKTLSKYYTFDTAEGIYLVLEQFLQPINNEITELLYG